MSPQDHRGDDAGQTRPIDALATRLALDDFEQRLNRPFAAHQFFIAVRNPTRD